MAEKKNLGEATAVSSMLRTDSVLVEIGGSVRRIPLDNLMDAINEGNQQLLRQVAWGVPIKQTTQSSPSWGRVGNLAMWEQYKEKMGCYLLTNTGRAAKLSKSDRTVFADGTTLDETKGHVMFMAPRLYFLVQNDAITNIPYLWMSELPIGGHFIEAPCFGAYKGKTVSGKLVSRSGYAPTGNQTIDTFFSQARQNGNDFGLINYDHRRFLMMLCLSEYGNPNAQAMVGYGLAGSTNNNDGWANTANLHTGATSEFGDECGKIDVAVTGGTNCSRVSFFGIEDIWGWQWEMTQGVYFGNSGNSGQEGTEIYIYDGNRLPTSAELATHPSGNYRQLARISGQNFIKEMLLGEHFDMFAKSLGGGSNERWCDYNSSNGTGQLLLWGGPANGGPYAGLGCASSFNAFSYASADFGSRLAYYGSVTIVNGRDL